MQNMIADHSLFLVKKLLQRIQQKAETLVTKVINPARKKTDRNQKYSFKLFLFC